MNRLELKVEPWILNPNILDPPFESEDFRRWAILTAIMRAYVDHPKGGVIPAGDLQRLHNGDDIEEWQVYIGKADIRHLRHAHTSLGVGNGLRGLKAGIVSASFAIGEAVILCHRFVDPDGGFSVSFRQGFHDYYIRGNDYLTPVPFGSESMPHLILKPDIPMDVLSSATYFFTNDPASPIGDKMARVYGTIRNRETESREETSQVATPNKD